MSLKAKFFKGGIFLLAFALVASETDFKTKFAEDFGSALRKFNAELANANMDHLTEFYQILLRDMNLTRREQLVFNLRLETIKQMKNRIGDSITAETMKTGKSFTKIIVWELVIYGGSADIKNNPEKLKMIGDVLDACAQRDNEALKEFLEKVIQKWHDLYKTIPVDELEKHAEYSEINELLENAAAIDILKGGESAKDGMKSMEVALRKITKFFDFNEYKFLFENTKI